MQSAIEVGEKFHIITQRQFKEEVRRHFAGTVTAVSEGLMRAEGYSFICNPTTLAYRRLAGLRTRIFGLSGGGYILNILPSDVLIERLHYTTSGPLTLVDGIGFRLEVNEFNASS